MNYVKSFDLFGVPAAQIPATPGSGAPTTATEGAVGCLYMDTDTGNLYKCTSVADGVYTWEKVGSGNAAFTTNAKALFRTLLYAAVYDNAVLPNPAVTIEAFLAELNETANGSGGGTGGDTGGDSGDEPGGDEPEKATYTVTYNLNGATSSNTATTATEGNSFTTVLSADSAIETVTVTMGGADITETVYNSTSGVITIAEVTGDIVITVALADPTLLYSLKDASFNGQTIVDTGIALFDEPKDFTILFDFVDMSCSLSGAAYIGLIEDDTVADSFKYFVGRVTTANKNTDTETITFGLHTAGMIITAPTQASDSTSRFYSAKLAATFDSTSNQWTGRIRNTKTGESVESTGTGTTATIANTIAIGGTAYRGKTAFTCNEFSIYNRVLSADEISAWMQ